MTFYGNDLTSHMNVDSFHLLIRNEFHFTSIIIHKNITSAAPPAPNSTTPYLYIHERSVALNAPHLQVVVLRKPCKKDIDTNSPR